MSEFSMRARLSVRRRGLQTIVKLWFGFDKAKYFALSAPLPVSHSFQRACVAGRVWLRDIGVRAV